MNRTLLFAAVSCALATQAGAEPRRLQLEAPPPDGARRFVSELKNLSVEAGSQTWETITRTGKFWDPRYGDFEITPAMLLQMVENFEKRTYGQDIMIDVAHKPDDGAAAKVLKLEARDGKLRALLAWTPFGADAVVNRGFRYFSADYHENWQDNEQRARHGTLLIGAGLTNRPVIKGLDPVDSTRIKLAQSDDAPPTLIHPDLHNHLLSEVHAMWKELIERLVKTLSETHKLGAEDIQVLRTQAEAAVAKVTEKSVAETLVGAFEVAGKQLAEARAAGNGGTITLQIATPAGLDADGVERLLAARDNAAKQLAETLTSRRKLLADTIGAAEGLDEQLKKELTEACQDLVTAEMSEDVVKRLAHNQITLGTKMKNSAELARRGFTWPAGDVRISVDSSNQVKELQELVDQRIFARMPADRRYALSGGAPIGSSKQFVEEALAQFDAIHGHRLADEHKLMKKLAAGDGIVSDVAVPVSFERTVLRESLYQMTGMALCDVGTDQFAAVVQLPYAYRDTTAAGVASARKYEGQSIARAGVKQELEEARPIPQKLAFEVSDELRYLIGNGQINFDMVAENARNAVRIIGEDGEQLVYDEHLNAADQYTTANIANENLELQADGAKRVFILAQWPVVRPKKIFDLQGNQVGNTLYPITVTYNGAPVTEYAPGVGAGTYYVMNYNLGEIYLVNQAGAIQTPADGTAYTCSYTYTTNVKKWDMDLGALTVEKKWNDFLYQFGTRRTALEDRQAMASMATMSGVLRDLIGQAEQFAANFKREGTDLDLTGNVGRIKDVPTWRSFAPGLIAGDQRIVIGERRTVRFRMLKPWQLNQLENQKDANGRFTGKKEAYGDQFIVVHTPKLLKQNLTSMVIYSAAARVARANP